jgi:hydroxyacylglutathione hydrolase
VDIYKEDQMSLLGRLLGSDAATSATEVDVTTAHTLQRQGAQFVDVREPYEFKDGHRRADRALTRPGGRRQAGIPRARTVAAYCQSGMRSSIAASLLVPAGYPRIVDLVGGFDAWHRHEWVVPSLPFAQAK